MDKNEGIVQEIYDLWIDYATVKTWGIKSNKIYDDCNDNIKNNIENELDCVRIEFENTNIKAEEYEVLDKIWNKLNYYKTKVDKTI